MAKKKRDDIRFQIAQFEKALEGAAMMARNFPNNPKYQKRLVYIQNKLAILRNKK